MTKEELERLAGGLMAYAAECDGDRSGQVAHVFDLVLRVLDATPEEGREAMVRVLAERKVI